MTREVSIYAHFHLQSIDRELDVFRSCKRKTHSGSVIAPAFAVCTKQNANVRLKIFAKNGQNIKDYEKININLNSKTVSRLLS